MNRRLSAAILLMAIVVLISVSQTAVNAQYGSCECHVGMQTHASLDCTFCHGNVNRRGKTLEEWHAPILRDPSENFTAKCTCHFSIMMNFNMSLHYTLRETPEEYSSILWGAPNATCADCHVTADVTQGIHEFNRTPKMEMCLQCHTERAGAEFVGRTRAVEEGQTGVTDIHYKLGLECIDCHSKEELHGDGNLYSTPLEAVKVRCTDCHMTETPPTIKGLKPRQVEFTSLSHLIHVGKVDCVACHAGYAQTFSIQVEEGKREITGYNVDFVYLGLGSENIFTTFYKILAYYNGTEHLAWMEYSPHTIVVKGKTCKECHTQETIKFITPDMDGEFIRLGGSFVAPALAEKLRLIYEAYEVEAPTATETVTIYSTVTTTATTTEFKTMTETKVETETVTEFATKIETQTLEKTITETVETTTTATVERTVTTATPKVETVTETVIDPTGYYISIALILVLIVLAGMLARRK